MSRRHSAEKRIVLPDAKYHDKVVAKFINNVMEDGKKPLPKRSFIRHSIFCLPKPNKTLWLFSAKRSKTSNLFWKLNPVASAVQPIRFRAKFVPTVVRLWQSAGLLPLPSSVRKQP